MKKYFIVSLVLFLGLGLFLTNCTNDLNPLNPNNAQTGNMGFAMSFDPASEIASGTVTITKGNITLTKPITIVDHQGSVNFDNIQVGHWHILVQLLDSEGYVIYTGEKDAIVQKDQTTTVDITVSENTGNLIVNVNVPGLILWNKLGSQEEVENSEIGVNGLIIGTPIFELGKFGNAYKNTYIINNDADYITFPPNAVENWNKFTVDTWFKSDWNFIGGVGPDDEHLHCIFSASAPRPDNETYLTTLQISGGDLIFSVRDQSHGPDIYCLTSSVSWNAGEWHHIAAVYDENGINGSVDKMQIYLDGVLVASKDQGVSTMPNTMTIILGNFLNDNPDRPAVLLDRPFVGTIDNFKFYNYAKTDFSDRFTE